VGDPVCRGPQAWEEEDNLETPEEYQRLTRVYHEDLIESLREDMKARKLRSKE
jgi:hypothetical protein